MNRGMSSIWYGTETDIEDLKQAQVKLRQDEQELRRMTDAIPQAIVVQRPDGTPIYANQVTLEYSGLTLEDVQADGFRERIFRPHDQEQVREERQKALAIGEPFEIEQRTRRNDGQYRWFLIRYNPLRDRSPVQHHTLPRRDRSRPYVVAEPDRVLSRGQGDRLVDLFRRKLRARSVEHGVVIRAGHFHCQGS